MKKNYGFKGNTPKQRVEMHKQILADGTEVEYPARVTHVHNNHRYHSTKGWKKINAVHGFHLLNTLVMPYSVFIRRR